MPKFQYIFHEICLKTPDHSSSSGHTPSAFFNLNYDNDHILLSALISATERSGGRHISNDSQSWKGSIRLTWKLRCWFNHPAESPPFRSASPVMTYAPIIGSCLLPTSKVPCGDAERSGEEKPTPWMGGVTEERMFDTSFGSPTSKNLAGDGRSRAAACSLWLWDNLRELRKCKNLIYSCMEEKVVRETRQECQELGSLVSTRHFFFYCVIRLSSTEQPDLVKVLWIGFVRNLSERFRWNGRKRNWPQVSLWLQSNTSKASALEYAESEFDSSLQQRCVSILLQLITASFSKRCVCYPFSSPHQARGESSTGRQDSVCVRVEMRLLIMIFCQSGVAMLEAVCWHQRSLGYWHLYEAPCRKRRRLLQ